MPKKKILIAILNWGLGHATRCIPIIKTLQNSGFEPVLASDGEALLLLQKEFPELKSFELPSYQITYPKKEKFLKWHFLLKSPQFFKAIYTEKRTIEKLISSERIDGIISDNRLGAFSNLVPSVYITHQIKVLSGKTSFFSSKIHRFFINKFSEVWVPDSEGKNNLSGKMSHGIQLKIPKKYLGIYSRFKKESLPKKYGLMVLLSGPESQRSLLEEILLKELEEFKGKVLFVKGKIEDKQISEEKGNLEICNFLTGKALETALNQSEVILARSGYSTLLDLATLGGKAFFIPTPGQYEQEYLAKRMKKLNIAPFCAQDDFSIEKLGEVSSYAGFSNFNPGFGIGNLFALFEGE